jgi:hypothetical protein
MIAEITIISTVIISIILLTLVAYIISKYKTTAGSNRSIMDLITVMSAQKNTIIIVDGNILVNGGSYGLNVVVIERTYPLKVKEIVSFSICCSPLEVVKLEKYIEEKIGIDDLVIISSRGNPFQLVVRNNKVNDVLIRSLKKLGMRLYDFTDKSNYVLVGTKKGDFYSESLSNHIAYHPQYKIKKILCRQNPFSVYPPKNYLFFNDKVYPEEMVVRCALERSARATPAKKPNVRDKFGLVDGKCVFVDDNAVLSINDASDSNQCVNGMGSIGAISLYEISAPNSEKVVEIFQFPNYKGMVKTFDWGTYGVPDEILAGSIRIPKDYFIHFVYNGNKLSTLFGPKNQATIESKNENSPLEMISITKRFDNSVIFCDKNNCFTLPPGSHVLSPFLFLRVNHIIISQYTAEVILYNDVSFRNIIQSLTQSGEVEFPKIVRAVKIK